MNKKHRGSKCDCILKIVSLLRLYVLEVVTHERTERVSQRSASYE